MSDEHPSRRQAPEVKAVLERWRERPLSELVETLRERYHKPLERDLSTLLELAEQSRECLPEGHLPTLVDLHETLLEVTNELLEHMTAEEHIIFPWILADGGLAPAPPIELLQHDHACAAALVARLWSLTDDIQPTSGECHPWGLFVVGLRKLARDLDEHMLLEDHYLFPRALVPA